jgi:RNA polymerase sigma factor (sigma-70 family)
MTPDDFEELMNWLDPDPDGTGIPDADRGAEKYEKIRTRIIKIYRNRGWHRPEEIVDETTERISRKIKRLRVIYKGDPALYFYAVAKRVYKEFLREFPREESSMFADPTQPESDEDLELKHAWLEWCLNTLKPEGRELILRFYQGEKREKIDNRKRLADELGITARALSLRALQIRKKLYACMQGYVLGQALPK